MRTVACLALSILLVPIQLFAQTAPQTGSATIQMGRVDVSTSDRQGTIEIDGGVVSTTGTYQGDLAAGRHHLRVTREGFEPYEKDFTLEIGQLYSEAVSLRLSGSSRGEGTEEGNARPFHGVYGGLGFGALFMPGGEGNTLDRKCEALGATCDTSSPKGASFFAFGGYSFNPIGFELFVLGSYDASAPTAHFDGIIKPGSNADLTGPARDEEFTIRRVGGIAAARVRYTIDGPVVRAHGAIGAGVAVRQMFMLRDAHATDGTDLASKYVPDSKGYVSPMLNFDLGVHFRVSGFMALTLGGMVTLESADMDAIQPPKERLYLVSPTNSLINRPHPTPAYDLARGVQFFLGPYVGLDFGP